MITLKDITIDSSSISLQKLIGKQIKDVRGYLTNEFGDPVFKMTKIEFDDGTFLGCEGEHDFPYLVEYGRVKQPNYDNDTLSRLYREENGDEDEGK